MGFSFYKLVIVREQLSIFSFETLKMFGQYAIFKLKSTRYTNTK